eukprot:2733432-Prymnesium_polylepis.1
MQVAIGPYLECFTIRNRMYTASCGCGRSPTQRIPVLDPVTSHLRAATMRQRASEPREQRARPRARGACLSRRVCPCAKDRYSVPWCLCARRPRPTVLSLSLSSSSVLCRATVLSPSSSPSVSLSARGQAHAHNSLSK